MRKGKWSLQFTIMILVCGVVALSLFVTDILISRTVSETIEKSQGEQAENIARTVARTPLVVGALTGKDPVGAVQSYANKIRKATGVEFIVVMDNKGIRKSHPDPSKIGRRFEGGDEGQVLKGKEHISISKGTLGRSLRSFTPVYDEKGKQVGAVAVGISLQTVQEAVLKNRLNIYTGTLFGILAGILGAVLLARYIKTILFGLEPVAIAKLLKERSAILQSVHEGIIAVDPESRITLVNKAARNTLKKAGIPDNPFGKKAEYFFTASKLEKVLKTGQEDLNEEMDLKGTHLLVNRLPVIVNDQIVGAVSTFRDKTEVQQLAVQLTGVRMYAEALRAQSHEFMNKLHVVLGMVHMKDYDQLSQYISELVGRSRDEMNSITEYVKDPVLAGFLIGKKSHARERGARLNVSSDYPLPEPADSENTHELITIVGNLIDNAVDAVEKRRVKSIDVMFDYADEILTIEVRDTGTGISTADSDNIFNKGYSTKGENRGIGLHLLKESLTKLGGELDYSSKIGEGTKFVVYIPYKAKGIQDD
ncbi:DcuS/MalK family sensor histidine kinase [Fictibacillus enclensis]|uniref:DcuS/MalK family sensor histidine kinase n=1 Tax=Fictibacillus enclensis TaxID=1017270 RepID=UPI0025A0B42B|nr:DcuS/MalK family sensor histidine kinase [Fictibacillus enclensis]MDM5337122.1 DcuS/MalK family sensor histidine kinase [Fictibacillus enclensis]